MTVYSEKNGTNLLTGSSDPDGDAITIRKINGVDIASWPHSISLPTGNAQITEAGIVTYDDQGNTTGHPGDGQNAANGTFTFTLWDGFDESPEYTATLSLEGVNSNVQSAAFGALTLTGAGGIPVTGTFISSGDPSGHFQITSGKLSLSATGQGSASGLYTLTLNNGEEWAITVEPDMYHVASYDEFNSAVADAAPRIATNRVDVVLRDGSTIGNETQTLQMLSIIGGGSLADVNDGVSNSSYTNGAFASFTGGCLVIRAETPRGATMAAKLKLIGCDKVKLEGINFRSHVPTSEPVSYGYNDNLTGNSAFAPNYYDKLRVLTTRQLDISTNPTHNTRGVIIIEDCTFGAPETGVATGYWPVGLYARYYGKVITQGCDFVRTYTAYQASDLDRIVITDCWFKEFVEDCGQFVNHQESGTFRLEASNNYFMEAKTAPEFAGAHSDALQIGTNADNRDYSIYYANNIVYFASGSYSAGWRNAPVAGDPNIQNGQINHTVPRRMQGFFMNLGTSSRKVSGDILNNFIMVNAYIGVHVDNGDGVTVANNTIVKDFKSTPHADAIEPWIRFGADAVNCTARDNIAGDLRVDAGGSVVQTGNYDNLDAQASLGTSNPHAFDTIFNGPFTMGPVGVEFTIDTSNRATTRAGVDSVFAPKSGALGQGKGHLY